jgi:hypothetical protein
MFLSTNWTILLIHNRFIYLFIYLFILIIYFIFFFFNLSFYFFIFYLFKYLFKIVLPICLFINQMFIYKLINFLKNQDKEKFIFFLNASQATNVISIYNYNVNLYYINEN